MEYEIPELLRKINAKMAVSMKKEVKLKFKRRINSGRDEKKKSWKKEYDLD